MLDHLVALPPCVNQGGPSCRWWHEERYRRFVADIAVRSYIVVNSTPSLAFSNRLVQAYEPVLLQAFRPELAIEGLDKLIVRCLAGPREVECYAFNICPQIQLSGDKSAPLIDPD
jgi:hypothetical protein